MKRTWDRISARIDRWVDRLTENEGRRSADYAYEQAKNLAALRIEHERTSPQTSGCRVHFTRKEQAT